MDKYVKVSDIEEYCATYSACLQGKGQSVAQAALRRVIEYAIENVSDIQPVKRGKWENPKSVGNGIIYCSICRNEAYWDTDYGQQLFDYCPYCGAKMK